MNNMDSHRGMQFVTQFKQILQLGLVERHNDSLLNYLLAGNRDELVVYFDGMLQVECIRQLRRRVIETASVLDILHIFD